MKLKGIALKRALVFSLVGLLSSAPLALAGTNGGQSAANDEKPDITLHGQAYTGWDLSTTGRVMVDGRFVRAVDRLQNGSRITVDSVSTARAEIKNVGRISIAPHSEVVLDMVDDTIVARMLEGSMRVEIGQQYGAYVETPDSNVVAHPGAYASFRVKASPTGTVVEKDAGDVETTAVDKGADFDIDPVHGNDRVHVAARKREELRVQVKGPSGAATNQPVVFTITSMLDGATGQFTGGSQRITTQTNAEGVASVTFEAGASSGMVLVEASIPGTEVRNTLHVLVEAPRVEDRNKNGKRALFAALAAGAIAGTVLAVINHGDDNNGNGGVVVGPPVVTP